MCHLYLMVYSTPPLGTRQIISNLVGATPRFCSQRFQSTQARHLGDRACALSPLPVAAAAVAARNGNRITMFLKKSRSRRNCSDFARSAFFSCSTTRSWCCSKINVRHCVRRRHSSRRVHKLGQGPVPGQQPVHGEPTGSTGGLLLV